MSLLPLPHINPVRYFRSLCLILLVACFCGAGGRAGLTAPAPNAERTIDALFSEEIQQAGAKLKWRGEALAPDTLYAIALTGLSWQPAWGREHLFYMGWGDLRKVPGYKQHSANYAALTRDIQSSVERRDWRRVVAQASTQFSLDEIACDANLKEAVGRGFLELRQPERAFPIFAAPFEPSRIRMDGIEANRRCREGAFEAARQAGLQKEAVAFALSLLLEPGTPEAGVNVPVLRYLEGAGVDMERILLGILQAPERLRGLPSYAYAAADLLTMRATPRLLPFFLHLAGTDDAYLRGRALVGLGVLAYRARRGDPPGWSDRIVMTPLREYGISVAQRKMIAEEISKAARSDNYRLRASACLALALLGDEESVPLLQKLAADKAYVLVSNSPARASGPPSRSAERERARRLLFPVRMAASAALVRYGVTVEAGGGELAGRDLELAKRGGQDVTNDRRSLRREIASQIVVSPIDIATVAPMDTLRR